MKAEIVCILVLCGVIVQGRSLKTPQLNRDTLSNALMHLRGLDWKQPAEQMPPLNADSFKLSGHVKDRIDYNQNSFQKEIDKLELEVQKIESKLDRIPAQELQTSIMNLVFKLYIDLGETFFQSVWEIYETLPHNEPPIIAEEYETTGNGITRPTPSDQLSRIANQVRLIGNLVDDLANGEMESDNMIQAIIAALDSVTPENVSTTTWTSEKTSTHGQPSEPATSSTTAGQPTAPATSSTTDEEPTALATSSTTAGQPTAPATFSITTEEPTAPATSSTKARQTESQNTTEQIPTTTTEVMVERENQLMRRRLANLIMKVLQRKTV